MIIDDTILDELNNIDLRPYLDRNDDLGDNPLSTIGINSQYYTLSDLDKLHKCLVAPGHTQLIALHLNIQSLPSKHNQLIDLLANLCTYNIRVDIITLCETFLHDSNKELYQIPGYSFVSRSRLQMKRGGVGLYINSSIEYKMRPDLDTFIEGEFETIFIETTNTHKHTVVGSIYRPPNTNIAQSIDRYCDTFRRIGESESLIGTDQNFDMLKIESLPYIEDFFNMTINNGMIPTITKPTRITHHSATLIDNIYIKHTQPYTKICSSITLTDISDHLPVISALSYQDKYKIKRQPLTIEHRKMTPQNIHQIANTLSQTNWDHLNTLNVDEAFNKFTKTLQASIDVHAPVKHITIPHSKILLQPWMTRGILTSSNKAQKMYIKCVKCCKSDESHKRYITYRNILNKLKCKAKKEYYRSIFNDYKYNMKKTWKTTQL